MKGQTPLGSVREPRHAQDGRGHFAGSPPEPSAIRSYSLRDSCGARLGPRPPWSGRIFPDRPLSALDGLRVLELTQVMAGPFCGEVLADMGADVVKVEPADGGDSTRRSLGFGMRGEDTAAFLAVNRNKRSVALDLKR